MQRKLLTIIAHEAHIMGRIYNRLGEPENPSEVYDSIEKMVDSKIKQFMPDTNPPPCDVKGRECAGCEWSGKCPLE